MKHLTLLFFLYLPALLAAQTNCDYDKLLREGKAFAKQRQYKNALYKYNSARRCDRDKGEEVDAAIEALLDQVEGEKKAADLERERAEQAFEEVDQQRKIAQEEKLRAEEQTRIAQDALNNLGKANADKVRLILAEVERNQQELNFDAALDKIKTAKILLAMPDSVDMAYQNLCLALLSQARRDLQRMDYKSALVKIKSAGELNTLPDSVTAAYRALRQFLYENARLDIFNTDYDIAEEKINVLHSLQAPMDMIESLWFEIAFCYTETGRLDRAADLLDTIAQLHNNNTVRPLLQEFIGQELAQQIRLLRQVREQLDPQRNDSLTARYIPPVSEKVPGGTFALGSDHGDETHRACQVTIKPFLLAAKELTFFEYDIFCVATNRPKPFDNGWGRGRRPVVDIDWYDAVEYCNWRSRMEGLQEVYTIDKNSENSNGRDTSTTRNWSVSCNWAANGYRLPTEAEWEFAAGNGEKHTRFSWGNDPPRAQQSGNVTDESAKTKFPDWEFFAGYSDGFAYTAPTGYYLPNDFGLYDMTGNVWEWCWDRFGKNYCRANKKQTDQGGTSSGAERVLRSGSWGSFPKDCFVSNRFHNKPDTRNFSIGFRLARNPH